jgi:hypothetical protein
LAPLANGIDVPFAAKVLFPYFPLFHGHSFIFVRPLNDGVTFASRLSASIVRTGCNAQV